MCVGGNADGDSDFATSGYYGGGVSKGRINQSTISLMEATAWRVIPLGWEHRRTPVTATFPIWIPG